jgi:hypothetical protein
MTGKTIYHDNAMGLCGAGGLPHITTIRSRLFECETTPEEAQILHKAEFSTE